MTGNTAAEKPLNERQKWWAEHYAASGNALQSAIAAGYSKASARSQSDRMLKNADVQAYLLNLTESATDSRIASVIELRQFWTATMRGEGQEMKDRLKSSELLGKSMGLFIEKREHSGAVEVLGIDYLMGSGS